MYLKTFPKSEAFHSPIISWIYFVYVSIGRKLLDEIARVHMINLQRVLLQMSLTTIYVFRSSHWRRSINSVLKNFAKFTGKHLCHSLFFNKVAGCVMLEKMRYSMTPNLKNNTIATPQSSTLSDIYEQYNVFLKATGLWSNHYSGQKIISNFQHWSFNPLHPGVAFLYPLKTLEDLKVFWCFQGDIEKQHRAVMG